MLDAVSLKETLAVWEAGNGMQLGMPVLDAHVVRLCKACRVSSILIAKHLRYDIFVIQVVEQPWRSAVPSLGDTLPGVLICARRRVMLVVSRGPPIARSVEVADEHFVLSCWHFAAAPDGTCLYQSRAVVCRITRDSYFRKR